MSQGRVVRWAAALLGALLLAAASAAAQDGRRWLAPALQSASADVGGSLELATGAGGHALLVWSEGDPQALKARLRTPGAAEWGPALDLAPGLAIAVEAGVRPPGDSVVLFVQDPGTASPRLQLALLPPGASAPTVETVASGANVAVGAPSGGAALAVDRLGGIVVAYTQDVEGRRQIVVRRRAPDGAWSAPQTVSDPVENALFVDVAADADGDAAVVFTAGPPGASPSPTVRAVRRTVDGTLSTGRTLSSVGEFAQAPGVALDPAGNAVAAWTAATPTTRRMVAATAPAGGEWGAAEDLGPGLVSPLVGPDVLAAPDGTITVAWNAGAVLARTRPPGGPWGPQQRLSPSDVTVGPPSVHGVATGGPDGSVVAGWTRVVPGIEQSVVQAAIRPAGVAEFGPALDVSQPGLAAREPVAAPLPGGDALAAWVSGTRILTLERTLLAADNTARPGATIPVMPVTFAGIGGPPSAVAGAIVRLEVRFGAFADRVPVQVQRRTATGFEDVGAPVRLSGTRADLRVRLITPGPNVLRLVVAGREPPVASGLLTVQVRRPTRPLAPVGSRPVGVATGAGGVWVLSQEDDGASVVIRVDPRTGRPGPPIAVGRARAIAAGAGAVWIAREFTEANGLARIDPRTGAVTEVPFTGAGLVAVGPAGVWSVECAIELSAPLFGFGQCGAQRLLRIDPATGAVAQSVEVVPANEDDDARVSRLTVGSRRVWLRIDADGGRESGLLSYVPGAAAATALRQQGLGLGPYLLSASGDALWAVSASLCGLGRASGAGPLVARGTVAGRPRLSCGGIVHEGANVWVSQRPVAVSGATTVPSRVVRLSALTGRPVGVPIGVGLGPTDLAVGFGRLWVLYPDAGVVSGIDPHPFARARPAPAPRPAPVRLRAAWAPGATVSRAVNGQVTALDVATSNRGRAVVVVRQERGRIDQRVSAALRRDGRSAWSAPQLLGRSRGVSFAEVPQVAANDIGGFLASWSARDRGGTFRVRASLLSPVARAFARPTALSPNGLVTGITQPALFRDGSGLVVWQCLCSPGGRGPASVQAASRPSGRAWTAPTALSPPGAIALEPSLGSAALGRAVVVWQQDLGAVIAVSRAPDGSFSAPAAISATTRGGQPAVAVNDRKRAVAAWYGAIEGTGESGVLAAARDSSGRWSAPVAIHPPARFDFGGPPAVGIDRLGTATVAVRVFDQRLRTVGSVAAVASVGGIAAVLGVLLVSSPDRPERPPRPPATPGALSVLSQPRRARDRLPAWVLADIGISLERVRPDTSRLALTAGARRVWVARASIQDPRGRRVPGTCLIDARSHSRLDPTVAPPTRAGSRASPTASSTST